MLRGSNGQLSSMRIMSMICVITACGLSIYAMLFDRDLSATAALVSALLLAAFGGKVGQSFSEQKYKPGDHV